MFLKTLLVAGAGFVTGMSSLITYIQEYKDFNKFRKVEVL
jgi:hypothetical protein